MTSQIEGLKIKVGIESYGYDELEQKIERVKECSEALKLAIKELNEHEVKISIKN